LIVNLEETIASDVDLLAPTQRTSAIRGLNLALLFVGAVAVFSVVASIIGLPGADTNARDTYNVITRLSRTLTYTYSRTPGQPVLDYFNFVFRSLGGNHAIHAWFVLVSAAGVTALYGLLRDLRATWPLIAVLTLALNPLFLTHVGGVGDFAISTSLLVIALFFANRTKPVPAAVALALAVGCRLVFCLYVIPVVVLIILASRAHKRSLRDALKAGTITAGVTVLLSALEYAPLFSFWGRSLLVNLPFQGLKYHATAFLFKLFVALGAPLWLVLAALSISLARRGRRHSVSHIDQRAIVISALIFLSCSLYFFRVPTKPELTLPILISIILFVQFCGNGRWAVALLLASLSVGFVVLSPYDRGEDRYHFHFEDGWYRQNYKEAYLNRLQLELVRRFLAKQAPNAILITRQRWTIEQAERSDVLTVTRAAGIDVGSANVFKGLGAGRAVIDPQTSNLQELLKRATAPDNRVPVFYEKTNLGLLRRWVHLDLAQYGQAVELDQ